MDDDAPPLWLKTLKRARARFEILADRGFRCGLVMICHRGWKFKKKLKAKLATPGWHGPGHKLDPCGLVGWRFFYRMDELDLAPEVAKALPAQWKEFLAATDTVIAALTDNSIGPKHRLKLKRYQDPVGGWLNHLFMTAWESRAGSPLLAKRFVITPMGDAAHDTDEHWIHARNFYTTVHRKVFSKEQWPDERPKCFFSIIDDAANSSIYMIDVVLDSILTEANGSQRGATPSTPRHGHRSSTERKRRRATTPNAGNEVPGRTRTTRVTEKRQVKATIRVAAAKKAHRPSVKMIEEARTIAELDPEPVKPSIIDSHQDGAAQTSPRDSLADFDKHDVDVVRKAMQAVGGPETSSKKVLEAVKMQGQKKGRILRALAAANEYRGYSKKWPGK